MARTAEHWVKSSCVSVLSVLIFRTEYGPVTRVLWKLKNSQETQIEAQSLWKSPRVFWTWSLSHRFRCQRNQKWPINFLWGGGHHIISVYLSFQNSDLLSKFHWVKGKNLSYSPHNSLCTAFIWKKKKKLCWKKKTFRFCHLRVTFEEKGQRDLSRRVFLPKDIWNIEK